MRRWRWFPRIVLVVLGVVVLGGLVWVLGPGAAWVLAHFDGVPGLLPKDLAAALDAIRGRVLAIATGLIALVAVYYTARNADTARQGHITDRYTKAIEQLGSDKLDVRLGGIYALERIARDSARDHPTVIEVLAAFIREHSPALPVLPNSPKKAGEKPTIIEVLAAFIREHSPALPVLPSNPKKAGEKPNASVPTDIQAALTVIGRRTVAHDLRGMTIQLTGANLTHADLTHARLTGANLTHADLTHARLFDADLTRADLYGADLTHADLTGANLTHARLDAANLTHTDLTAANLTHARLDAANLTHTDLTSANLTHVIGLPPGLGGVAVPPAAKTEPGR